MLALLADEKTPPNTNTRRTAELAFKALDTDGSGGVNLDEFIKALERFGMHVSKAMYIAHVSLLVSMPNTFLRSRGCARASVACQKRLFKHCSTSMTPMVPVCPEDSSIIEDPQNALFAWRMLVNPTRILSQRSSMSIARIHLVQGVHGSALLG